MRFVPVREFRLHPGAVWRQLARERELILTARGRPVGLLTPLKEATFEETLRLWRQLQGLVALQRLQHDAKRRGLDRLKPAQVQAEIHRIRGARQRRAS